MIQRLSLALNLLASGIASRFYYINARIALGNLKVTQFYRRHTVKVIPSYLASQSFSIFIL